MSLGPDEVQRRIALAVATALGVRGWRESPYVFDQFPGIEGDSVVSVAHDFAVGLGGSMALAGRQRRTGAGRGVHTKTDVRVRFVATIQADGQVEALREALADEQLLVDAVLAADRDPQLGVQFVEIVSRSVPVPGLFLGEVRFAVHHMYPLGTG